jgi:hypothetical protein
MGKKNIRHGGWLWLKRGEMPEGCEEIRRGVSKLHADLADEFAGPGVPLTASQMVLIDRACQLTAFLKLVEREVWKKNPVVPDESGAPKVAPALGAFYIAATNAVAKALRTLSEVSSRIENSSGKQTPDVKAYLLAKAESPAVRRVQRFSDDEPAGGAPDFPEAPATDSPTD